MPKLNNCLALMAVVGSALSVPQIDHSTAPQTKNSTAPKMSSKLLRGLDALRQIKSPSAGQAKSILHAPTISGNGVIAQSASSDPLAAIATKNKIGSVERLEELLLNDPDLALDPSTNRLIYACNIPASRQSVHRRAMLSPTAADPSGSAPKNSQGLPLLASRSSSLKKLFFGLRRLCDNWCFLGRRRNYPHPCLRSVKEWSSLHKD